MKFAATIFLVMVSMVDAGSISNYEWTEGNDDDMITECSHTMTTKTTQNGMTVLTDTTVSGVNGADTAVMMFGTTLVMFQTPAIGIAQAGMIRRKNSLSMMMQCMSGMAVGSILWFVVGYSLTFGPSKLGGIIGNPATFFFLKKVPTNNIDCLSVAPNLPGTLFVSFQMMFALMVPVIITGAWAEKMNMKAFFMFMVLWPLVVYYPVAHWVWGGGWMSALGVMDFAGGITIHTAAGVAALVVSLCLQKRRNLEKLKMTHHNIALLVIGATIIWAGWYSFNGCSALAANATAALALLNTHISGCVSGMTWVLLTYRQDRCFHVTDVVNGAFAGLAGITPGSGYVASQSAFLIGFLVGVASWSTCRLLKSERFYIDDVLDVFSLQGTPGMLGSILLGFFRSDSAEYGYSATDDPDGKSLGIVYGGNGELLASQVIGVMGSATLSAVMTFCVMMIIKKTVGVDITWQEEEAGLDLTEIGEIGYDYVSTANDVQMDSADMTQQLCEAAAYGNLGKCKNLKKAGANVSKGDYDKRTPLHLAAAEGRLEICKWLIGRGADVNALDNFDRSPLEEAVLNQQDIVAKYLEDMHGKLNDSRITGLLCQAVSDGNVKQIMKLTQRHAPSVNAQDYDGRTALHVAVSEQSLEITQLLVKQGAKSSMKDRWGNTALDDATKLNLTDLMELLQDPSDQKEVTSISVKAPESQPEAENITANKEFMRLAAEGDLSGIKNLVEKGGNPGTRDYDKRTPLHIASADGHADVVNYLVQNPQVNINGVDRFKNTPLADAVRSKCNEVAEILKRNGATVIERNFGSTLCAAAARGDVAKLQKLSDSGVDLAHGDYDGRTALHLAVCSGQVDVVKFLVKRISSASLNVVDRMKNTPLDDAVNFKQDECKQVLLDVGAVLGSGAIMVEKAEIEESAV